MKLLTQSLLFIFSLSSNFCFSLSHLGRAARTTAQRVKPQQVLRQLSNSAKPVQGGLGGEFFLPILGTAGVGVNYFVGFLPLSSWSQERFLEWSRKGDFEKVQLMKGLGVNLNGTGIAGHTALIAAAREGYVQIVEFLLEEGADPNQANDFGVTPLGTAVKHGHKEVVKLLAAYNVCFNQKYKGENVLAKTVDKPSFELLKLLCELGGNGIDLAPALERAEYVRDPRVIEYLRERVGLQQTELKALFGERSFVGTQLPHL